jgi:hypothetical protein
MTMTTIGYGDVLPVTAGAYHLLTIVHVLTPHLSCFKASLLASCYH